VKPSLIATVGAYTVGAFACGINAVTTQMPNWWVILATLGCLYWIKQAVREIQSERQVRRTRARMDSELATAAAKHPEENR